MTTVTFPFMEYISSTDLCKILAMSRYVEEDESDERPHHTDIPFYM